MPNPKDKTRNETSRRSFLEEVVVGTGLVVLRPEFLHGEHVAGAVQSVGAPETSEVRDGEVTVTRNEVSSEITLSNDLIRLRFHPGKPKFGVFPKGYVGYSLELRSGGQWVSMAVAPYFCGFVYRAVYSGRDFLAYVIPQEVKLQKEQDAVTVVFSAQQNDTERVGWHFTFTFTIRKREPTVRVTYTASADQRRDLLLFWGPRLYAGEGTFGAAKDEALFPGLEYLNSNERSSNLWAFAPDAKLNFVPHPAKITIPLMTVVHHGRMVGLMWDPMQKWNGADICPSALFASPNWIENKQNHLLGLFLPSVPQFVSENGLRAHTPAIINSGQEISLQCQLFASEAAHAADAVDLYLEARGGLPHSSPPMEPKAALETLVRNLSTNAWNGEAKGWKRYLTDLLPESQITHPDSQSIISLAAASRLLEDSELARQAQTVLSQALKAAVGLPPSLPMALRVGGVAQALQAQHAEAVKLIRAQQHDGSWTYVNSVEEEQGLIGLHSCPEPGILGRTNSRDEGLTAGGVVSLLEYVLISADQDSLKAALRGIGDLDRHSIPFGFQRDGGYECPHCPSLQGAYLALRSYLLAYRITGEKRHLKQAAYWAKAGLPFIYLWSLPAREVEQGEIETNTYLRGDQLYRSTRRDPMLYGSLYGYGSSEFVFSWYGILVEWIGLDYGRHLMALAEHDQSLPWKQIAQGVLGSVLWVAYDQLPYGGYYPDGFNLMSWTPSGPGIIPSDLLSAVLSIHYNIQEEPHNVVLGNPGGQYYLSSAATIGNARMVGTAGITFNLNDPNWSHCRAILTGVRGEPLVTADGKPLPKVTNLEETDQSWSRATGGQLLVKVRRTGQPRQIVVRPRG